PPLRNVSNRDRPRAYWQAQVDAGGSVSMTIRNLLIPILEEVEFDNQLAVGHEVTRAITDRIKAVFIRSDPNVAFASLPPVIAAAGVTAAQIEQEGRKVQAAARARFNAWCKEKGVEQGQMGTPAPIVCADWSERVGSLEGILVRLGRVSDLIILNKTGCLWLPY